MRAKKRIKGRLALVGLGLTAFFFITRSPSGLWPAIQRGLLGDRGTWCANPPMGRKTGLLPTAWVTLPTLNVVWLHNFSQNRIQEMGDQATREATRSYQWKDTWGTVILWLRERSG